MTLILGIDPGSRITGYGVIRQVGSRNEFVACGCLKVGEEDMTERLTAIYKGLREVIATHLPLECAIEKVFLGKSADSALKLGQARGVAIVAAANSGLSISEYSARQVKLAVVGKGAAEKHQVQHMVKLLLKLDEIPQADAADALAIALCHANTRSSLVRMAGSAVRRGRVR